LKGGGIGVELGGRVVEVGLAREPPLLDLAVERALRGAADLRCLDQRLTGEPRRARCVELRLRGAGPATLRLCRRLLRGGLLALRDWRLLSGSGRRGLLRHLAAHGRLAALAIQATTTLRTARGSTRPGPRHAPGMGVLGNAKVARPARN